MIHSSQKTRNEVPNSDSRLKHRAVPECLAPAGRVLCDMSDADVGHDKAPPAFFSSREVGGATT
jgi:hypothetical protein